MKRTLTAILFLVNLANVFSQTNYFVDGVNGSNTNNGTSLATAWKTIQKACNSATPNSIVQIVGGTYNENLVLNVTGTAGNPIVFTHYQNDSVFINGTGTAGTTMLYIQDKNYLSFSHLVIQNLTVNNAQGILIECSATSSSTNLSFSNITIRHINWTASAATVPTSNDNAQGFIVYGYGNNAANAVKNLSLDSCWVYSNILGFSEGISLDGNIDGFSITHCKVHDNTNIGIDIAGNYVVSSNPAVDHARNGKISKCQCYNNVSAYATSGGIYVDGGWNTTIERCVCYGNGWGIEIGCEENGTTDSITVKNNLIYQNEEAGIAMGGYTTATTGQVLHSAIRNNTFFENNTSNSGVGEMYLTKFSMCTIINNIFYTNAQDQFMFVENISPQTNNTLNYNNWYTPNNNAGSVNISWRGTAYSTFATYKSGTGQEANSFYGNPLFSSTSLPDLHISGSSPAVNAGSPTTTITVGETDYDGNGRIINGVIDCGAYELVSGGEILFNEFNQVTVFPNPASNDITVRLSNEIDLVTIYNWLGEIVLQTKSKNKQEQIDVSKLPSGVYVVLVLGKYLKFIKE